MPAGADPDRPPEGASMAAGIIGSVRGESSIEPNGFRGKCEVANRVDFYNIE